MHVLYEPWRPAPAPPPERRRVKITRSPWLPIVLTGRRLALPVFGWMARPLRTRPNLLRNPGASVLALAVLASCGSFCLGTLSLAAALAFDPPSDWTRLRAATAVAALAPVIVALGWAAARAAIRLGSAWAPAKDRRKRKIAHRQFCRTQKPDWLKALSG